MKFFIINDKPKLSRERYDSICPDFDPDLDILTLDDLIIKIKKIYRVDRERFNNIREFLEEEFGDKGEPVRRKTVDLYKILLEGSGKYYDALKGPNGRFKNLRTSDIILPPLQKDWLETHAAADSTADSDIEKNTTEYAGTEEKRKMLNVLNVLPVIWKKECKHTVIVGEVGMGKTVTLIHWWENYLENREKTKPLPVFIDLNEFNQLKEEKREGFVLSMIYDHYGNTSTTTRAEIWEAMKRPLPRGEYIPSMVLLLDGYNEITVEKKELLLELNRIVEQCPGLQVIITSRYDMRDGLNWIDWNLVLLPGLGNDQVEKYLTGMEIKVPEQERVFKVLRNPMKLKLYTSECKADEFPKNLDAAYKASVLWEIAELHREEKDFYKAFSCAQEAFSMDNQQDREVVYRLGIYAAWAGDTDTASSSINRSIELGEHNWRISKKDISKFLRFLTAGDSSIEQQAIDEVDKMAADVEQLEEAQNHNFLLEMKKQLRSAYEKMRYPSYYISSLWIKKMFKLEEIIECLKNLTSLYKKNDANKKRHSELTRSLQFLKNPRKIFSVIFGTLCLISYLTTAILFAKASSVVKTPGIISTIIHIPLLLVIYPLDFIFRLLFGEDLFLWRFIMGYLTIFLFLLAYIAFGLEVYKEGAVKNRKIDLKRKINDLEIEINNAKAGERRIKKQLGDIIGD